MNNYCRNGKVALFIGTILISFIFYGVYLKPHYSLDTYYAVSKSKFLLMSPSMIWDNFSITILKMGRFGLAVLFYMLSLIGINPMFTNMFSNFIGMLFFSIAFFYTIDVIRKRFSLGISESVVSMLLLIPFFMNPLYCDWFQYSEAVVYFSFSLMVGTILSLKICFGENLSFWKRIIYVVVFFFCLSIHQTILNLFLIYSSFWMLLIYFNKEKFNFSTKKCVKRWLNIFLLYIFLGVIQLTLVLYYGNGERINRDIFENVFIVLKEQPYLWMMKNTGGSSILLILSICIGMIGNIILEKKVRHFLIIVGFFCFLIGIIFSTHILAEPWLSHRTIVFLYSIPSVFALLLYSRLKSKEFWNQTSIFFFLFILIIILNTTYALRANSLAISTHKNNAIDKQVAVQICNQITNYEKETGIRVTKISFRNDSTLTYVNPEVFMSYDMNPRAFVVPWSRLGIIEINLDRELEEVDMPASIYETYFKDKDWSVFEEEQVKIIGNTVYVMIY